MAAITGSTTVDWGAVAVPSLDWSTGITSGLFRAAELLIALDGGDYFVDPASTPTQAVLNMFEGGTLTLDGSFTYTTFPVALQTAVATTASYENPSTGETLDLIGHIDSREPQSVTSIAYRPETGGPLYTVTLSLSVNSTTGSYNGTLRELEIRLDSGHTIEFSSPDYALSGNAGLGISTSSVATTAFNAIAFSSPDGLSTIMLTGRTWTLAQVDALGELLEAGGFAAVFGAAFAATYLAGHDSVTYVDANGASLHGGAGNDTLTGGSAVVDTLTGGHGHDTYVMDGSADAIVELADQGTDTATSLTGSIVLSAGAHVENITLTGTLSLNATGNELANNLVGNGVANSLSGGAGNDTLTGGAGNDTLAGGADDDLYLITSLTELQQDVVDEEPGEGFDTVRLAFVAPAAGLVYTAPDDVDAVVAFGTGIFHLAGNGADNRLEGNASGNSLTGAAGADTLIGAAGNDTLAGGTENDSLSGGDANDALAGGDGADSLDGGAGADTLDGGSGVDVMTGGAGNDVYVASEDGETINETLIGAAGGVDRVDSAVTFDLMLHANIEHLTLTGIGNTNATGNGLANTLLGNAGDNSLSGGALNDSLAGGAGNDTLDGGTGNDTMSGGLGDDLYIVDAAGDRVNNEGPTDGGIDTVESAVTFSLAALTQIEHLTLTGAGNVHGTGNALANLFTGTTGNNSLSGAAGSDTLNGGVGNDTLLGGTEADSLSGGDNNDSLSGDAGADTLNGEAGNDTLLGGADGDTLIGGTGNDLLDGGTGTDSMAGGDGDDTFVFDSATDVATEAGSEGNDTVRIAYAGPTTGPAIQIILGTGAYANIENVVITGGGLFEVSGTADADLVTGNGSSNTLIGGGGDDTLDGGAGNDSLVGGTGNDTYVLSATSDVVDEQGGDTGDTVRIAHAVHVTLAGGLAEIEHATLLLGGAQNVIGNAADNRLEGGAGSNSLDGAAGVDTLVGGAGNDTLAGGTENDSLSGGDGNDSLVGGSGVDSLDGGAGNDTLDGGDGIDEMTGGAGSDVYRVSEDGETITETIAGAAGGVDRVESAVTFDLALYANIENLTLTGSGSVNATGNGLNNALVGNAGNNSLIGGAGNDTMTGNAGDDTYVVDAAGDQVIEGLNGGTDLIVSSVTYSIAALANVEHLTLGGGDNINATGNGGLNVLTGNTGNNSLVGGLGNDTLNGGDGNDTLDGGGGTDAMDGGIGDDTFVLDSVADTFTDAGGNDTVRLGYGVPTSVTRTSIVLGATTYTGIENAVAVGAGLYDLTGDGVANSLTGNGSGNVLTGNGGNDTLDGGGLVDTMIGGTGNDTYVLSVIGDEVDETGGDTGDAVRVGYAGVIDLSTLYGGVIEHATLLLAGAQNLFGNAANNSLEGGAGNNSLSGVNGADTLIGGAGNDTLDGGTGVDTMEGGAGNDLYRMDGADTVTETLNGGTDTVETTTSSYTLLANFENLTLLAGATHGTGNTASNTIVGNTGNDSLSGLDLNDSLSGGAGNDTLDGGTGNDTLSGGLGNDLYIVDAAGDRVNNEGPLDGGTDTVQSSVTFSLAALTTIEHLTLTLVGHVNATGNALANILTGNSGNNSLSGAAGTDSLVGGDGHDILSGGTEVDTLSGGEGNDTLDGGTGVDSMAGGNGDDTFILDNVAENNFTDTGGTADTVRIGYNVPTSGAATLINLTVGAYANIENLVAVGTGLFNFIGNASANALTGNGSNNSLNGAAGNDTLAGGGGNDTLVGGTENDSLSGGDGNDTLDGGAGNDTLDGGAGNDTLNGGANDDTYVLSAAGDDIIEASGIDTIRINYGVSLNLQTFEGNSIENATLIVAGTFNITGSTLANRLEGNASNNSLDGAGGTDTLIGNAGNDTLVGGDANDTLTGGDGNDSMVGGAGSDAMDGGAGNDVYVVSDAGDTVNEALAGPAGGTADRVESAITFSIAALANVENITLTAGTTNATGNDAANSLIGSTGNNTLSGGAGNDTLDGGTGNDSLVGGADNDSLIGGAGNDTLDGGTGNDTLTGGAGNDLYIVDAVGDRVNNEAAADGTDTVQSDVTFSLALLTQIEHLTLAGAGNTNATGNTLANILTGSTGNNSIVGGLGNDTLNGGNGNDTLDGGVGIDSMTGGAGDDTYTLDVVGDIVVEAGGGGSDTIRLLYTPDGGTVINLGANNIENVVIVGATPTNAAKFDSLIGNAENNLIVTSGEIATVDTAGGNDTIDMGFLNNQSLTGGSGDDSFIFSAAYRNGASSADYNVKLIQDFVVGEDTLVLDVSFFTGSGAPGALAASAFVSGAGVSVAQYVTDRVIYNTDTGNLYYDPDGTGAATAVRIAVLDAGLALSAADFELIA